MKELVAEIDVRPIRHVTIADGAITEAEEGIQVPVYDWKEYEGEVESIVTEEAQAQRAIAGMVRLDYCLRNCQWLRDGNSSLIRVINGSKGNMIWIKVILF
jgi:hypothetical protein